MLNVCDFLGIHIASIVIIKCRILSSLYFTVDSNSAIFAPIVYHCFWIRLSFHVVVGFEILERVHKSGGVRVQIHVIHVIGKLAAIQIGLVITSVRNLHLSVTILLIFILLFSRSLCPIYADSGVLATSSHLLQTRGLIAVFIWALLDNTGVLHFTTRSPLVLDCKIGLILFFVSADIPFPLLNALVSILVLSPIILLLVAINIFVLSASKFTVLLIFFPLHLLLVFQSQLSFSFALVFP